MPDQLLFIFLAVAAFGLGLIILGFKFSEKTKKVIETTGAIIFHVGVFGILYHKVSLNLFISLVALVFSLFILIDPLKIANYVNSKIYRLVGYITLFSAFAFALDYFSGFPVWLWAIPLIIYLSPYLISPLRKHLKLVMLVSWLVVFSYVGLIGYVVYSKYNPEANTELVYQLLPQLKVPKSKGKIYKTEDFDYKPEQNEKETQQSLKDGTDTIKVKTSADPEPVLNVVKKTEPSDVKVTTPIVKPQQVKIAPSPVSTIKAPKHSGPFLNSLQKADQEFIALKKDYQDLIKKYEALVQENKALKQISSTSL